MTDCDAGQWGAVPTVSTLDDSCRCIVCSRCGHHTGNSNQGHYWAQCKALIERARESLAPGEALGAAELMRRTKRAFHFCCDDPAFGCELEPHDSGSEC